MAEIIAQLMHESECLDEDGDIEFLDDDHCKTYMRFFKEVYDEGEAKVLDSLRNTEFGKINRYIRESKCDYIYDDEKNLKKVIMSFPVMKHFTSFLFIHKDNMMTLATRGVDSLMEQLRTLHSQGYIHRDIKPENIMYDDVEDKLIFIDFDIATKMDDEAYNHRFESTYEVKINDRFVSHGDEVRALEAITKGECYVPLEDEYESFKYLSGEKRREYYEKLEDLCRGFISPSCDIHALGCTLSIMKIFMDIPFYKDLIINMMNPEITLRSSWKDLVSIPLAPSLAWLSSHEKESLREITY